MNSKKEYGANCIVRQTVLFRDSVVERERENGRGDADREELEDLQIQGGSPKEGGSTFGDQFTQRMKKKRGKGAPVTSPKANRKKRLREVGGSEDTNLSGRPNSKLFQEEGTGSKGIRMTGADPGQSKHV